MQATKLQQILSDHKAWLNGESNGKRADLQRADLQGAYLQGASLLGADLRGAKTNYSTAFFNISCPEEGSFVAWKKCKHDVLVKLLIPEDAKRSSATSYKCRASKATVLAVEGAEVGVSDYDSNFVYKVGETVEVTNFDDDRWNECSTGIHFFVSKQHAKTYN